MKKNLIRGIAFVLSIALISGNNFVFAGNGQGCQTCFAAPSQLTNYFSAMRSAVDTLKSAKSGKIEDKVVGSVKIYMDILVSIPREFFGQDMISDIKVIFNGYPAVRDWKRIVLLDQELGESARFIAQNGNTNLNISDSDISRINNNFNQIKFMSNFQVQKGATYGEAIAVLWQVHKLFKEAFLSASYTNSKKDYTVDKYIKAAFKGYEGKFSAQGDYPYINSSYLDDLSKSYECSLGPGATKENSCPNTIDKFLKNMDDIIKSVKDVGKVRDKLKNSRKKLQDALKGIGDKGFGGVVSDQHIKIKHEIQVTPLEDLLDIKKSTGVWSMGKLVQKAKDLNDGLRGVSNGPEEFNQQAKDAQKSLPKKDSGLNLDTVEKKDLKIDYYQNMRNSFEAVLENGKTMVNDIPMETPDPSPTSNFPQLSKKVYTAKKQLKDIKDNMKEACETQCENAKADCGE